MSNWNIIQHGTQTAGLGVMIGKCSHGSKHGEPNRNPAKVGCSSFSNTKNSSIRYTNNEQINHLTQRPQRRKWTREDIKPAQYRDFRSNPTKIGYRKRIIEIWTEFAGFKTTNQMLADEVWTIIKNGWFSNLEILVINHWIDKLTLKFNPSLMWKGGGNR